MAKRPELFNIVRASDPADFSFISLSAFDPTNKNEEKKAYQSSIRSTLLTLSKNIIDDFDAIKGYETQEVYQLMKVKIDNLRNWWEAAEDEIRREGKATKNDENYEQMYRILFAHSIGLLTINGSVPAQIKGVERISYNHDFIRVLQELHLPNITVAEEKNTTEIGRLTELNQLLRDQIDQNDARIVHEIREVERLKDNVLLKDRKIYDLEQENKTQAKQIKVLENQVRELIALNNISGHNFGTQEQNMAVLREQLRKKEIKSQEDLAANKKYYEDLFADFTKTSNKTMKEQHEKAKRFNQHQADEFTKQGHDLLLSKEKALALGMQLENKIGELKKVENERDELKVDLQSCSDAEKIHQNEIDRLEDDFKILEEKFKFYYYTSKIHH